MSAKWVRPIDAVALAAEAERIYEEVSEKFVEAETTETNEIAAYMVNQVAHKRIMELIEKAPTITGNEVLCQQKVGLTLDEDDVDLLKRILQSAMHEAIELMCGDEMYAAIANTYKIYEQLLEE